MNNKKNTITHLFVVRYSLSPLLHNLKKKIEENCFYQPQKCIDFFFTQMSIMLQNEPP